MDWNISIAKAVEAGSLPQWLVDELGRQEFCGAESYCLDFKRDGYSEDVMDMAEAVKDIASLYNAYGGFILFGVEEIEKDVRYRVAGIESTPFNMQLLKGKCESWLIRPIPFAYDELELKSGLRVGVLHVPKRPRAEYANAFQRRGPETKPGKFTFDAGQIAVRRGDKSTIATELPDWQLALGPRELDALGASLGRVMPERQLGAALDNNMPTRSVICSNFVGRVEDLTHLWQWLQDDFQFAKVIAGEGGKGKTSLAYEFATQVAYQAPLDITRIVWLTAKKRQFSGIENTWKEMPETHFQCFRSLLIALGQHLAFTEDELQESSDAELRRMVHSAVGIQPTLFVLDDIDSLSLDDQRRALEFAQQCGRASVRFLLTTRSNASYSSDAALTLRGLEGAEYNELLEMLVARYSVELPPKGAEQLAEATRGSPLLTDSILRVVRRGNSVRKAIDEWKGQSGEDARNAVLGREIEQLSREAKRALLSLAYLGECSKTELMSVSGLLEYKLEDALEELRSLFIVSAPKIIESEPRFEIGLTAALLVISLKEQLASDYAALERAVRTMRKQAQSGVVQKHNRQVGKAISQALALIKDGNRPKALETINAALRSQKNNPDLLLFKARQLCDAFPPDYAEARKLIVDAHKFGARKPVLFDLWYKSERELGFGHGVIEAATAALKEFPAEEAVWAQRRAEGYVLNGLTRNRNREFDQAYGELSSAAVELHFARMKASASEASRIREFLYGVHDQLLAILPATSLGFRSDAVSLIRELTDRGDYRFEVLQALSEAIILRVQDVSRKTGIPESQRARLEQNIGYVTELLRSKGLRGRELIKQIEELPPLTRSRPTA